MSDPQTVEAKVNVKGNFSGNLVAGNYNLVVNNPNGGVVNVVQPSEKAASDPRPRPVNLRPRNFPGLLDRTAEIESIKTAIESGSPTTVFGENGIGKTSLLRKAAFIAETKNFPDGVVYLLVRDSARDDLLQELYDAFFTGSLEQKPTDADIRSRLKDIHALVILDDITLGREDAAFVLDAMPQSLFLLASIERALWGEGQVVALDGLPEADAVLLFQRELGRALTADEKPIVEQICRILLSHPLRILQAASMIREDGLTIPQTFQKLTGTRSQSPVVEVAVQRSNDTQKKIFSLLAVAGGFALTREHVSALVASPGFDVEVSSLIRRGFVQEAGSSLSLSSDAASSLMQMWDLSGWEDALVNHFSTWLKTGPQDMLVDQLEDVLYHLLKRTGEKKQWHQLVTLGQSLERISIFRKKWQRWVQILDLLRMAARGLADKKLEGWVLHQTGTRAMCLGMKEEAQGFLKQALDVRRAIGDKGGIQVTQNNLNVLLNAPVVSPRAGRSAPPRNPNLVRWLLFGGVVGGGMVVLLLAAMLWLVFGPGLTETPTQFPPPPTLTDFPTQPPTLTFTPTIPTGTIRPTNTSRPTITPTPAPVVLFDFVERANEAEFWETVFDFLDGRSPEQLKFLEEIPTPSPEQFASFNETAYVGWQSFPLMEDETKDDELALLTYPFFSARWVQGTYDLTSIELRRGDVFKAKIGYKLLPSDEALNSKYVTFAVYFYEIGDSDRRMIGEYVEFYDGVTSEWEFPIPGDLIGRNGFFVLEVYSGNDLSTEWLVWLDAVLMGLPR